MRTKKIGIFDSGFGGLDVMRGITKKLPEYGYVYLADSARVPYGERSKNTIYKFTKQAVDFLVRKNCTLIILACNTVSCEALWKIQHEYVPKKYPETKVLGVLIPAIEAAVGKSKSKKIGVMATNATVKSKAFILKTKKINPKVKVFQSACPELVPLIEEGDYDCREMEEILKKYLPNLMAKKIDTLILGCTHYGIVERKIRKMTGGKIRIVSQSKIVSGKLKKYLQRHPEVEKNLEKNKKRIFFSTDPTDNFQKLGSRFFGENIKVKKVKL